MATKKMQEKKAQKKVEKAKEHLATEREVALKYEKAGDWSSAFDCWTRIARMTKSSSEKKEAAGRAAAAKVRAQAKPTQSAPLDDQLAESKTADANARSWDSAMPEPGYVPPAGDAGGDDAADDADADEDATAAAVAPTGERGARDAATTKPGRARGEPDPRLPPVGSALIKRDRQGNERARCTIVEGGVEYRGTTYKSISAAAMAAAKDLGLASKTQDGYAFFGLKKGAPRAARKDAVGSLEKAWERYRERVTVAAQIADDAERARVRETIHQHAAALMALAGGATA